ncbi:MAG: LD-carboxypeptidase [Chloroherpetonaceae bacterium]|nr:LD-carboxypeptidase [Chloroherpetonaceae bacterium]
MPNIKPKRLKRGDVIGVIAPASPVSSEEKVTQAVKFLERLGFSVKFGANTLKTYGYLAGTDEERADDINSMFADKDVKAIFCLRGGYGTPRLLQLVNYRVIAKNPKILAGFSDITALSLAIYTKTGLITFSAPMIASDMAHPDDYTQENFWSMLTEKVAARCLRNFDAHVPQAVIAGESTGKLIGGNFSLVSSLIGTPFLPQLNNAILLLEDIGEEPYRIDRMFSHLYNGGIFKKLNGLALGQFSDSEPDDDGPTLSMDEVISHYAKMLRKGKPAIQNLSYGHIRQKLTLPIGAKVLIKAYRGKINFELKESVIQ